MKLNKLILTAIAGSFLFVSCSSDDDSTTNEPRGAYDNGLLILNEGGYNAGNASVSFLSEENILENNVFATINSGATLGDTGQDMGMYGETAYIVVNNSHKIEVVNRFTFERITTITTDLDNPRYIAFSGNDAYVTNWGDPNDTEDDYVAVIDLATNAVTNKISVVEGPEAIVENNGKLYVAHKGGFGYGNTVSVINASNSSVVKSIAVGDVPNSLEIDGNNLYVLSEGLPSWSGTETPGELSVVNLGNDTVEEVYPFTGTTHPSNFVVSGNTAYYTINDGVYAMNISDTSLPANPLFTTTPQEVYGVYELTVKNDAIYVADAGDYNSDGKIYIYSLTGTLQQTFTVGVIPAGFYFND